MIDPTTHAFLPTLTIDLLPLLRGVMTPTAHVGHEKIRDPRSSELGYRISTQPGHVLEGQRATLRVPEELARRIASAPKELPGVVARLLVAFPSLAHEDYTHRRTLFGECAVGWVSQSDTSLARLAFACGLDGSRARARELTGLALDVLEQGTLSTHINKKRKTFRVLRRTGTVLLGSRGHAPAPEGYRGGTWATYRLDDELLALMTGRATRAVAVSLGVLELGHREVEASMLFARRRAKNTKKGKLQSSLTYSTETLCAELGLDALSHPLRAVETVMNRLVERDELTAWHWERRGSDRHAMLRVRFREPPGRDQRCHSESALRVRRRQRKRSSCSAAFARAHSVSRWCQEVRSACGHERCAPSAVDPCRSSVGVKRPPLPGGAPPL